jgi:hypothetical protein
MSWTVPGLVAVATALGTPCLVFGASSTTDDRIGVSADGATLTGTNGGGGASVSWLHAFNADVLATVAAEHQVLAGADWTFGSVGGSWGLGAGDSRYTLYGEAHEGAGDDGPRAFHYSIEAAGVIGTYFHRLSVQLEDRRIDVETTHGNLPKFGLSYLWNPHLLTNVAYSYTVSGNLGTRLTAARIDLYGAAVNLLGGVAFGQASPAVVNLQSGIVIPGRHLHEGFVGVSKPLPRARGELTLVADYLDLGGIKRATVTLSYIFHVGAGAAQ